jgi:hypothetical protein
MLDNFNKKTSQPLEHFGTFGTSETPGTFTFIKNS